MTKVNINKKLLMIGQCTAGVVLATIVWYLLGIASKRADGCEVKAIVKIGRCDEASICIVKYDDGTQGIQRLPIPGFGYTVCPP